MKNKPDLFLLFSIILLAILAMALVYAGFTGQIELLAFQIGILVIYVGLLALAYKLSTRP